MKRIGSLPFSMSKEDFVSILKGAAIVGAGSVLTYLATTVIPELEKKPGVNVTLVAVLSVLINGARKWVTNTTQFVEPTRARAWLALMLLIAVPATGFAQQPLEVRFPSEPAKLQAVTVAQVPTPAAAAKTSVVAGPERSGKEGLTFRDRQRLGLGLTNVGKIVQRLKDAGQLDQSTTDAELAAMVMLDLQKADKQKFSGLDLEQVLRWLELIMPLIRALLKL